MWFYSIHGFQNTARETVVDYMIVRKNPSNSRGIRLEMKGSQHFRLKEKLIRRDQTNCSIILERPLDFEAQSVHVLRILALVSLLVVESLSLLGHHRFGLLIDGFDRLVGGRATVVVPECLCQ